ncbi:hypothetical protein [Lysinibacillus cavernae]|uniref:hypothetical protein n=1 Tax=Lysinibacillus cavernae TaxID=2666135 RepID=UPI0012D909DD|nr:hypothetical protein [Lysinibacillus cavernae]
MAGQARPPHLKGVYESSITILSSYHEGADPKSILLNGVVGEGLSNATLLNTNGYIEFSCSEEITLWACGGYYSDGGGNSGSGKVFIQKKQIDGTFVNLKETNCPLNTTIWLDMTGKISAGTYRIATSTSRYPVFSEFFAQNMVVNKSFVLHDGEYKKWDEEIPEKQEVWSNDAINLVQKMTSNSSNGQIAFWTYNTSKPGAGIAYNVFDYATGSENSGISRDGSSGILGIIFSKEVTVARYEIEAHNIATYAPRIFNIEGSNDSTTGLDGTWTKIDSRTGIYFSANEKKTFTLEEQSTFRAYRLNISATNHSYTGFAELRFFPPKVLLEKHVDRIPAHWTTVSSTLPSSTQFLERGIDNLSPLFGRKVTELEPTTMTDKSGILGVGETGKVFSKTIDLKKYFDIRNLNVEVR